MKPLFSNKKKYQGKYNKIQSNKNSLHPQQKSFVHSSSQFNNKKYVFYFGKYARVEKVFHTDFKAFQLAATL